MPFSKETNLQTGWISDSSCKCWPTSGLWRRTRRTNWIPEMRNWNVSLRKKIERSLKTGQDLGVLTLIASSSWRFEQKPLWAPCRKNTFCRLLCNIRLIFSVAFKLYDLDNDDLISKDELLAILHMMVGTNISEEQLTSIAERTILEADEDGDQMISFEEFCKALNRTDVEQKMSIRFLN